MANDTVRRPDPDEEIPVEVVEDTVKDTVDDELTQQELEELLSRETAPPPVPSRKARLTARRAWASALLKTLSNFVNRIL